MNSETGAASFFVICAAEIASDCIKNREKIDGKNFFAWAKSKRTWSTNEQLGKSATETLEVLQMANERWRCNESIEMSRVACTFQERWNVSWVSLSLCKKLKELQDHHQRPRWFDVSLGSVQAVIMSALGMSRIAAEFVLRLLTFDQREDRIERFAKICFEGLQKIHFSPLLWSPAMRRESSGVT